MKNSGKSELNCIDRYTKLEIKCFVPRQLIDLFTSGFLMLFIFLQTDLLFKNEHQ
jgi:hypothetical protein